MTAIRDHLARADTAAGPSGRFVVEDGVEWYRIDGYDLLQPFLMSIVAPTNQWMFVSSSGALTAGREGAQHALFPYDTDDRLHAAGGLAGPLTLIRVDGQVWQPFAPGAAPGSMPRSLAKTAVGDRLSFEERNPSLGLTFRYRWETTRRHGFVRTSELLRDPDGGPIDADVLDGLVDVLPAGVERGIQQTSSTLVDAYRRSEVDARSGIALFTLEALISDRPEPKESLRANVVWSTGLGAPTVALSTRQVGAFRAGAPLAAEHLVTGRKGAFLVSARVRVDSDSPGRWVTAADVALDQGDVAALRREMAARPDLAADVRPAVAATSRELVRIVAAADALQETSDRPATVHHFANVLFNCMRGGVFVDGHRVALPDLAAFVGRRNAPAAVRAASRLGELEPLVEIRALREFVRHLDDPGLERLVAEYLPLVFSRRHGDPSRPWNEFHINVHDGSGTTGYEGNWRDIFQNWEALGHSYPEFLESFVAKFVNASTVDGFNPYRLTDRGIDWEVPEEGSWSNFGYWGDHQIEYLARLLDAWRRFDPGEVESQLDRRRHSYADVPYRIAPFDEIVRDPKNTIVYDTVRAEEVERRVAAIGEDGRLLPAADGDGVHHATLAEKLLVPALSKLSNLAAGGGIWMNTQRPEWNDANNALVGNGVSMVTLVHLRGYLELVRDILVESGLAAVELAPEVARWAEGVGSVLATHADALGPQQVDPEVRRAVLDGLGGVFSAYRAAVYDAGLGAPGAVDVGAIVDLFDVAGRYLDHAIANARRPDGLYETYYLMRLSPGAADLERLHEMLEGQVALIGSGALTGAQAADLAEALFGSALYRPDQRTFMLHPNTPPPSFLDKNVVPAHLAHGALARLVATGDTSVARVDVDGVMRFAPELGSGIALEATLDGLVARGGEVAAIVADGRAEILDAYEAVFRHRAFTGRSGTMYKYEGLGSVYWHMVSKLLRAVQERALTAAEGGEDPETLARLVAVYRRIRAGLGFVKTPAEQGAFPTDPHSHTPAHAGAQQPGMTGQAKEGVLIRWGELGVGVAGGQIRFRPILLRSAEFLTEPRPWPGNDGEVLDEGTLGFTYCGVPVVYRLTGAEPWVAVTRPGGAVTRSDGDVLDPATSRELFLRRGLIERIEVGVPARRLLPDEGA